MRTFESFYSLPCRRPANRFTVLKWRYQFSWYDRIFDFSSVHSGGILDQYLVIGSNRWGFETMSLFSKEKKHPCVNRNPIRYSFVRGKSHPVLCKHGLSQIIIFLLFLKGIQGSAGSRWQWNDHPVPSAPNRGQQYSPAPGELERADLLAIRIVWLWHNRLTK